MGKESHKRMRCIAGISSIVSFRGPKTHALCKRLLFCGLHPRLHIVDLVSRHVDYVWLKTVPFVPTPETALAANFTSYCVVRCVGEVAYSATTIIIKQLQSSEVEYLSLKEYQSYVRSIAIHSRNVMITKCLMELFVELTTAFYR